MSRRGLRMIGATTAAAIALLAGVVLASAPATAQPAASSNSVTISVERVTPLVPAATSPNSPMTFTLTVTNRTGTTLSGVTILAERDQPITTQTNLNAAIASGKPSPDSSVAFEPTRPIKPLNLAPHVTTTVEFTTYTTTAYVENGTGICLCAPESNAIYPLFFSAHVTSPAGVDLVLGYGATYLAGTFQKPAPVQVAWLWPLIDRPHRLDSDTVFTDDDLTTSVSPGGRLYRALDVAETVADATDVNVQLTLLIDPELIDELQVMASGKYQVQDGKTTKPGSGEIVAQDWLARLHDLITTGAVDARLTPYADPDIESLSRHGLSWSATMPAAMKTRVTQALGGLPPSTVSWPAGSALSANTLASLVKGGASTVVLDSGSVRPPTDSSGVPVSLARLSSDDTDIVAALTSSSIEKYAAEALTLNGAGTSVLPALMSQLAIRATGSTGSPQTLLITAPRYVDPDESLAEQVITATSSSRFTTPTSLTAMTSNPVAVPTGFSQLAKAPAGAATLSATALGDLAAIGTTTDELKSMLDPKDEAAQSLLAGLPAETQRIASAGWYGLGAVSTGNALADQFTKQVATVPNEVYIVTPSSGTYTLASSNSPLPLTVENDSRYRVRVQIDVPPVYGLTVKPIGEQWIEPQSKRTLHLPTDVERSGHIKIQAKLETPSGKQLGNTVYLTVHSTALGVIGIVITVVAGVVLVLALVVRFIRRLRRRRAAPADGPEAASLTP